MISCYFNRPINDTLENTQIDSLISSIIKSNYENVSIHNNITLLDENNALVMFNPSFSYIVTIVG